MQAKGNTGRNGPVTRRLALLATVLAAGVSDGEFPVGPLEQAVVGAPVRVRVLGCG